MFNIVVQIVKETGNWDHKIHLQEFYGGGVFFDLVTKNFTAEELWLILTIDKDIRLAPIMRVEAELEDKRSGGTREIIYGCGKKLLDELLRCGVDKLKSPININVVYLDYCGWWNEEKAKEVQILGRNIGMSKDPALFGITVNRSREHYRGESKVFANHFKKHFVHEITAIRAPAFKELIYYNEYMHGKNKMATFLFKKGGEEENEED